MSIFVQIVGYKGFDVLPTVRDCIEKSKDRDSLHFGIVLQQDEEISPVLVHERIKVERVSIAESLGHGWARRKAQAMYGGQDYTLQIDAGCRMAPNWDEGLIQALKMTGSQRPIVTNPSNKFNVEKNELEFPDVSYKSQAFQFFAETPYFWPVALKNIVAMQRARNISDHFFFAEGRHCTECPYDPELYFSEIESALSVRSFTLGYDIFHHFRPFVFRNYSPRTMNWNDDQDWWLKDRRSKERFVDLVEGRLAEFGLGSVRSLREWELYSGVDYKGRRLQKDAISGIEPPCNFQNDEKWESDYMKDHSIVAAWDASKIEDSEDYDYWLFAVEDETGAVIHRQDLRWERDRPLLEKKLAAKKIFFKSVANRKPSKLLIQPFSKSKGALSQVKFDI